MMQTALQPPTPRLDGTGLHIGIVVARYNWHITGKMLQQAQEKLQDLGVALENLHVVTIPGSYELATTAAAMLTGGSYDALICFGCVMKGETRHDVVVSDAAAQGIQRVALDTGIPIIFGVMCVENQQQAEERIPRGKECAEAAVEMARTIRALQSSKAKTGES
ncbi:MAG TPA: 6,7-dimethyl-8-ribityllumazine synthase [Ktedonobacteraceae bacterium]|nr:6,7-dimethyl-8-ribityllumazine synthase [Ktedonobacteraceae bacterium]